MISPRLETTVDGPAFLYKSIAVSRFRTVNCNRAAPGSWMRAASGWRSIPVTSRNSNVMAVPGRVHAARRNFAPCTPTRPPSDSSVSGASCTRNPELIPVEAQSAIHALDRHSHPCADHGRICWRRRLRHLVVLQKFNKVGTRNGDCHGTTTRAESTDRPTRGLGQTRRGSIEIAHEQNQRRNAGILNAKHTRLAIDVAVLDRLDEERRCGRHGSRNRGVGESHLRLRRLSAVQVVVPRLFIPRIRIPLRRRRHLQPELGVERHRRIEVLDHRTVGSRASHEWDAGHCARDRLCERRLRVERCDLRLRDERAERGNEHRKGSGNGLHGVENVTIPVRYLMERTR